MKQDPLGDKVKSFESEANDASFPVGAFLLARVDGRAFHTFTAGMAKPYDRWILDGMIQATKSVFEEFGAKLAFVQSDEATFALHEAPSVHSDGRLYNNRLPFKGRVQKLCSLLAGCYTAAFIDALVRMDPQRYLTLKKPPAFDCRIWQVPGPNDQVDAFLWREKDAIKNSVSAAASTIATPKELDALKHRERLALLAERGVVWENYPQAYRLGSYIRRIKKLEPMSDEVWARIPEHKRPARDALFDRHSVGVDSKLISVEKVLNIVDVLTFGAEPKYL